MAFEIALEKRKIISILSSQEGNSPVVYPLYDGHGSVIALSDSNGVITDTYDYTPYGKIRNSTGSTSNPYQYSGERTDSETGFQYLRARYYNTDSGRFTTRDTWAGVDGSLVTLNKYLYGNGNPVRYVDPSGHMSLGELSVAMHLMSGYVGWIPKLVGYIAIATNVVLGIPTEDAFRGEATQIMGVGAGVSIFNGFGAVGGIDFLFPDNGSSVWVYGYVGASVSFNASYNIGPSGVDNFIYDADLFDDNALYDQKLRKILKKITKSELLGYTGLVWGIENKKGKKSYSGISSSVSLSFVKLKFGGKLNFPLSGTFFSAGKQKKGEEVYGYLTGVGGDGISISATVGRYWYLGGW